MRVAALLFLVIPFLHGCFWREPESPPVDKPYAVQEVTDPPRLIHCELYRPPLPNDAPAHAMQVRFTVTRDGWVRDAECVREGPILSSDALLGEALSMARSCSFRPGTIFERPVAVRMSMWFYW